MWKSKTVKAGECVLTTFSYQGNWMTGSLSDPFRGTSFILHWEIPLNRLFKTRFLKLNYVDENIILLLHYSRPTELSTHCRILHILNRAESCVLWTTVLVWRKGKKE